MNIKLENIKLDNIKNNNLYNNYENFIKYSTIDKAGIILKKYHKQKTINILKTKLSKYICYPFDINYGKCIEYLYIVADIYKHKKLYRQEAVCYEKMIDIYTNYNNNNQYHLICVYSNYAKCLEKLNLDKAIMYYFLVCEIYNKSGNIHNVIMFKRYIADLYKQNKRIKECMELYNEILNYYKNNNMNILAHDILDILDKIN